MLLWTLDILILVYVSLDVEMEETIKLNHTKHITYN